VLALPLYFEKPGADFGFLVLVLALLAGLGCGARAMLEPGEGSEPLASAGAGGAPTSDPSGRGGTAAVSPPLVEDDPEPACAEPLARARTPRRGCPFLERDLSLCYQTEACACAGACRPGEQCIIGGFLSPEEPQLVSCVDLR
jgi:hypothetical protein